MDESPIPAERLLTLSSAARRLADLVAASQGPLRYEVVRHLLRVSEETMTEVLEETVALRLVRRGPDPFTYVPHNDALGDELRSALGPERLSRMRVQIASASERVMDAGGG